MIGASIVPFITDNKKISLKKRCWGGLLLNIIFLAISWTMALVVQYRSCNGRVDKPDANDLYSTVNPFPTFDVVNSMAWFPDVCKDFPQVDDQFGEGTCTDGCTFLEYCRITKVDAGADAEAGYDNYLCDPYFPRCAYDGKERKYKADYADYEKTVEAYPKLEEHQKCKLDLVLHDSSVCSTRFFHKITDSTDKLIYRLELIDEDYDFEENMDKLCSDEETVGKVVFVNDLGSKNWFAPGGDVSDNLNRNDEDIQADIKADFCSNRNGLTLGEKEQFCIKFADLKYSDESALVVATYVLMGISDAIYQVFILFLISIMANGNLMIAGRYSAAYKGIQSAGAAVAWLTDMVDEFTYIKQSYVCLGVMVLALLGAVWTISQIEKTLEQNEGQNVGSQKSEFDQNSSASSSESSSSSASDDIHKK